MILSLLASAALAAVPPELADAVATGDCARVLEALPAPSADDERLIVGHCLTRRADPRALEVLAPVTAGVYGDHARRLRARALLDKGLSQDALAALEGVALPGQDGLEVRLLRGRALIALDRSLEARDDLRELLRTDVAAEARYWLAWGAETRGDADAARVTYQALWSSMAAGPWDERAAERLVAMGTPEPTLSDEAGQVRALSRFEALAAANQHDDALALLLQVREIAPARVSDVRLARAQFAARRYAEASATYQRALGEGPAAAGAPSDLFDYALGTSRAGDYATADVIYRRLQAQHPDSKQADTASFKLGYLAYDAGELAKARELLEAHVVARPGSAHLDEALWFRARAAWRLGDRAAAVADLDRLMAARSSSGLVPGALYWKARAKGLGGDVEGERAALEELLRRYPVDGYAYFATLRLGRTFPARERVAPPPWPAELAARPEVARAEALLAVGLRTAARAELAALPAVSGKPAALALAHALVRAGDYREGRRVAGPWCAEPWNGGDASAQQACTPMPEASIVAGVASRYGLDPLVPYGIMTAESALDPSVTSIAGARGLMQLMPGEAGRIHAELYGERPYDPDDLYAAPYNASLGTAELGMKLRALDGAVKPTSLPAAIAAYNGGEEAVRRWLAAYPDAPEFDEFAEDIGYTETRRYVRRVLGYTMAYRWVYGDPPT